ncbi:MAG: AbrB/MazE/SpoVT family DNA-binding domain-containing protein [Rhodoferax sp.]|nr:AbrB/MazE/SpoVT family DNA-binding domain-containing protein [Rhodoferax sp.]
MQTKLTSQGQVSVPAPVRKFLHLIPGSALVWTRDGDRIVVERATRHSTAEVHLLMRHRARSQPRRWRNSSRIGVAMHPIFPM